MPADLTDSEWELIEDLIPSFGGGGRIGRPPKWNKRDVVNAILYVAATGCQWRALPACYPHWNTVHRYHVAWSREGIWEQVCARLVSMARIRDGREPDPTAAVVDARSVQGASTVGAAGRGFDAGKKVSGRKTFAVVDTLGLLLAVVVVAARTSDNVGGIAAIDQAAVRCPRLAKVWNDSGFKKAFARHCRSLHITAETVTRISAHTFEVLPRRWVVERTWGWLVNSRRLRTDYERDPEVHKGFVWAAHTRMLLRRLTKPAATLSA